MVAVKLAVMELEDDLRLAERVRSALLRRALSAYEDAAVQGLCSEGAWEVAVAAMQKLDLSPVVAEHRAEGTP
jgi:hypothetical protein